jgi:chromosome segregation ATPase
MTSSRYFLARLAQSFGYNRKSHRMSAAASEMHLLREAEAQLGFICWTKVEAIDELSVEYWNLRKFIKEKEIVQGKLAECQALLDRAHEERAEVLSAAPEVHQDLLDERIALLTAIEELAAKRDRVIAEAREVRRSYEGFRMKLEVLGKESSADESHAQTINQVKERLAELKVTFSELKELRAKIAKEIEEGDAKLDVVDAKLIEKKQERRVDASRAFQVIGDGNKQMSVLRAEDALLDTQMRQLYAEIGRFLSRHASHHAACTAATSSHRGLVDVMRALRRSIALNHRLAGNA